MSDPERRPEAPASADPDAPAEDEEFAATPFDGPWFLPVVLLGLAVWFGYDGWFNDAPELQDDLWFNRIGFGVLALAGAWYARKAVLEGREEGGDEG